MGRQRNNCQAKEKEEFPEKELNEIEASKLSDIEFKVMFIRMLKELNENHTSMKKDMETIRISGNKECNEEYTRMNKSGLVKAEDAEDWKRR